MIKTLPNPATDLLNRACSCFLTWHDVSKSDGGHGDEAEVEGLEKGPAIPPKNINTILDK